MPTMLTIIPPKLTFAQWRERMPPNWTPRMGDFRNRWDQHTAPVVDPTSKRVISPSRPMEIGEERAYMAWLMGIMEEEEALAFRMVEFDLKKMIYQAIVPVIRDLREQNAALALQLASLTAQLKEVGLGPEPPTQPQTPQPPTAAGS